MVVKNGRDENGQVRIVRVDTGIPQHRLPSTERGWRRAKARSERKGK